jgi:ergothioneine biosynthesis protein EgtB
MNAPALTTSQTQPSPLRDPQDLADSLFRTRRQTHCLAAPLGVEDQAAQANEDASPTKWHLAHTTWFFETFVLQPFLPGYRTFDPRFNYCFNSYYEAQGPRQPRALRGLLTRPTCFEVRDYRAHVDEALHAVFAGALAEGEEVLKRIEIGVHHEQQHQELLLTDILSLFAQSPLRPAYREGGPLRVRHEAEPLHFIQFEGGRRSVGHAGEGFVFDNEGPRHDVLLRPFQLADRLVTNAEWAAFMSDGGYRAPALWLADGWARVARDGWRAPLYWEERDGQWLEMTLWGLKTIDAAAPVCCVSYFEADAYARWAGKRLPTEFEWECAAGGLAVAGNMLGADNLAPRPASPGSGLRQMFGDVWEWTQSAYAPYPGYRPADGALGEYNGKFMCGQQVLRGASCATPDSHARRTYRNFFYPHQRWQFCGLRLADEG